MRIVHHGMPNIIHVCHTRVENLLKGPALHKNLHLQLFLLRTYNFCYNSNYQGIIANYKHVSSTFNFLLFPVNVCIYNLAIIRILFKNYS